MNKVVANLDCLHRNTVLNMAFIGMTTALGLLMWLAITHLQSKLDELTRNTEVRESILHRAQALRAESTQLKEQLLAVKTNLESMQAKFPDLPEESQFLQELSQRAIATGISLGDFRPGGITRLPCCKEIELRLRGTGGYTSVCRLLDSFGTLPRIVRFSQISISGPATAGGDCIIDIQLNLLFGLSAQRSLATLVRP